MQKAFFGIGRRRAGQQMVEGGAEAVYVAAYIGVPRVAAVLFQGGVRDGAASLHHGHSAGVVRLHDFDKPEIDELDHAVGRDFDVARLDVPVEHGRVLAVQVGQGVHELTRPPEHLFLAEEVTVLLLFMKDLLKISSFDKIHDQVFSALRGEIVRDFGQVGVVQARECWLRCGIARTSAPVRGRSWRCRRGWAALP